MKISEWKSVLHKISSAKFFFPVAMNTVVMLILTLFFYARYQCEADIIMQTLLYGVSNTGEPVGHLIFSNILLGELLAFFAHFFPSIAWYTIFHYLMAWVAMVVITAAFVPRKSGLVRRTLATIISVFIGYECFITPMYMKTAALLAGASVLLLWHVLRMKKPRILWGELAVFLGFVSSLISYNIFLLVFSLSALGLLACFLRHYKQSSGKRIVGNSIVILLLLVLACRGGDLLSYNNNEEWQTLGMYREALEQEYVFGFPDYDDIRDSLLAGGYTTVEAKDYQKITAGFFPEGLDVPAFVQFISQQKIQLTPWKILLFFHTVPIRAFKTGMFYLWLILAFVMAYQSPRKKTFAKLAVSLFIAGVPYFIDYSFYGYGQQWMGMIAYIPSLVYLITVMPHISVQEERYMWVYLCLTGLVLYYIFSGSLVGSIQDTEEVEDVLALREEQPQYLHLIDFNFYIQRFSVFVPYPRQVDFGNCGVTNGIYTMIPGFRTREEVYDFPGEGYKIYSRNETVRKSVVDNLKARVDLKKTKKESEDAFHTLEQWVITRK